MWASKTILLNHEKCQNQCSCSIPINLKVYCSVTNRHSNRLTEWLSYINDWKELYKTVIQSINIWFHFRQSSFSLKLWCPINRTLGKGDNETSSALHTSWINEDFMPLYSVKIFVRIAIWLANIGTWIKYQSLIPCCFQIATDALQFRFMQIFWTKHTPCI